MPELLADREKTDSPAVVAPPPIIFLTGGAIGFALESLWPSRPIPDALARGLGIPLVALGIVLMAAGIGHFLAARTSVNPYRSSANLICAGLYRFSRNPIYLADFLLYLGAGLWLNSAWIMVMAIPVAIILKYGVVLREERYLERKFGEQYVQYRERVPRWL